MITVLYQCSNEDLFLKHYHGLLRLGTHLPDGTELTAGGIITETSVKDRVPFLTPELTGRMADFIRESSMELAERLGSQAEAVMRSVSERSGISRHTFLLTIGLSYLWQGLWSLRHHQQTGGSAVAVYSPEKCSILYADNVGVTGGSQLSWLVTPLQKNNRLLQDVFRSRNVARTLSSMSPEDRTLIPAGDAGEQLKALKLAHMKQGKQDYVASFALREADLTPDKLESLVPALKELTRAGQRAMNEISKVCDALTDRFSTELTGREAAGVHQAFYYVFSYVLAEEWARADILPSWQAVRPV